MVQPIGILAVPVAVLLTSRVTGLPPNRRVLGGVALAVVGTGSFVLLAASGTTPTPSPATSSGLLTGLALLTAVVVGLRLLATRVSGVGRCLAWAGIGAASFGSGSALIRLLSRTLTADPDRLLTPLPVTVALAVVAAMAVGAWAVQQAYASGAAAVVTGVLTVGDPVVAILLSAGLLGEGLDQGVTAALVMTASAAAAAWGVRLLARHHRAGVPDPPVAAPVLVSARR